MTNQRIQQLITMIGKAKRNATSLSEVEAYERQEAYVVRKFLSHKLGSKEYEKQLDILQNPPQRVICQTVEELQFVLDYLCVPEEEQKHLFEHEKAHFNEAKANGLQARFCLTFYKTPNGYGLIPGTQIHATFLNNLTDDTRRLGLKAAILGPKDMSGTDKNLLGLI